MFSFILWWQVYDTVCVCYLGVDEPGVWREHVWKRTTSLKHTQRLRHNETDKHRTYMNIFGWWFGTFFIFPYWGVETTNQILCLVQRSSMFSCRLGQLTTTRYGLDMNNQRGPWEIAGLSLFVWYNLLWGRCIFCILISPSFAGLKSSIPLIMCQWLAPFSVQQQTWQ